MDDASSPNSSDLSVFDSGSGTDTMMQDDSATSPFSSTHGQSGGVFGMDGDSFHGSFHDSIDDSFHGNHGNHGNHNSVRADSISSSIHSGVSNTSVRPVLLLPASGKPQQQQQQQLALPAGGAAQQPQEQLSDPSGAKRKRRSKKNGLGLARKDSITAGSASASDTAAGATTTNAAGKVIKRRAARACVSCRNRKVRCDVVETFPCGNCRWDKIECRVQEGRRRRRGLFNNGRETSSGVPDADGFHSSDGTGNDHSHGHTHASAHAHTHTHTHANHSIASVDDSVSGHSFDSVLGGDGTSSFNYAAGTVTASADTVTAPINLPGFPLLPVNGLLGDPQQQMSALLPGFIRPIPGKMAPEDIVFLHSKGAFALPDITLQQALLHAFVEYVYPYMPLLELHPFLQTVHDREGKHGTVSLLLYHAVMFAAAAFVPAKYLKAAGFNRRREARKSFFMKARVLYDFDYETDRLTLVQALLLMTYWYETPDDQKDTWHWMGVAVSLAHTIGLHRDPRTTGEPRRRQRLRKLLWWCCFMRDRMIALGMRRPKRIRSEDADVPMLTPDDFDTAVLPDEIDVVPAECRLVRDVLMQEQLAELCVEKAKLCVLVGSMLQQQYTILPRGRPRSSDVGMGGGSGGNNSSTMMLFPNRPVSDDGKGNTPSVVDQIDAKLRAWLLALPLSCRYAALTPVDVHNGRATVAVHRTLLHLVYHTTMSALHRPRIQPAAAGAPMLPLEQQEFSRARVRDAADCVTRMGGEMLRLRLEPYLPTAGVTVFLPAMFAHLLDLKGGVPHERRQQAVLGFLTCMRVMESLRETYAAAEIAKGFVESLLKKAGIDLVAVANFADDSYSQAHYSGLDGGSNANTGTSTPVNGTSTSLLNATSNVGVPYTEDGIAHAVAMYAANTPKASPRSSPPPALAPAPTSAASSVVASVDAVLPDATTTAVPLLADNAPRIATGNASTATHPPQASYLPTPQMMSHQTVNGVAMSLAPSAVSNGMVTANTAVEQLWGLTPSGSAISEDSFEWDVTTDPNGMKLDFDQWLDFPPEGMGSSTDRAFSGLFSTNFGNDIINTEF